LIDWVDLGLNLLNILVIAGIAYFGWNQWKSEWLLKKRFDVSRDLMKLVYEFRSKIKILRTAWVSPGEEVKALTDQEIEIPENEDEFRNRGNAALLRSRLNDTIEIYGRLDLAILEASMVLDEDIKELFSEFDSAYRGVNAAAKMIIRHYEGAAINAHASMLTGPILNKFMGILYGIIPDESGENKTDLAFIVGLEKLEEAIKPYLKLRK